MTCTGGSNLCRMFSANRIQCVTLVIQASMSWAFVRVSAGFLHACRMSVASPSSGTPSMWPTPKLSGMVEGRKISTVAPVAAARLHSFEEFGHIAGPPTTEGLRGHRRVSGVLFDHGPRNPLAMGFPARPLRASTSMTTLCAASALPITWMGSAERVNKQLRRMRRKNPNIGPPLSHPWCRYIFP